MGIMGLHCVACQHLSSAGGDSVAVWQRRGVPSETQVTSGSIYAHGFEWMGTSNYPKKRGGLYILSNTILGRTLHGYFLMVFLHITISVRSMGNNNTHSSSGVTVHHSRFGSDLTVWYEFGTMEGK